MSVGDDEMPAEVLRDPPELVFKGQDGDEFISFLRWLADEHRFTADGIIAVVEDPHNYADEWSTFLFTKGDQ